MRLSRPAPIEQQPITVLLPAFNRLPSYIKEVITSFPVQFRRAQEEKKTGPDAAKEAKYQEEY